MNAKGQRRAKVSVSAFGRVAAFALSLALGTGRILGLIGPIKRILHIRLSQITSFLVSCS